MCPHYMNMSFLSHFQVGNICQYNDLQGMVKHCEDLIFEAMSDSLGRTDWILKEMEGEGPQLCA